MEFPTEEGSSPFAPGNEAMTPPEITAIRTNGSLPDTPGWTLRVVPNKYPALTADDAPGPATDGEPHQLPGYGVHEVIVETERSDADLGDLSVSAVAAFLRTLRDRVRTHAADRRLAQVVVFKNHGETAGATIRHAHTQLLGLPLVPGGIARELDGARAYYQAHGRCFFCDAMADASRMIDKGDAGAALAPFAPRLPYETWIVPRRHHSHFEAVEDAEFESLAALLRRTLRRLAGILERPPYNLILHSAPLREAPRVDYHWHLEIIPRVTNLAGFELGTGWHINPVRPEEAARRLKETHV